MTNWIILAAIALMLTMALMRKATQSARRDRSDGIRWRGIDWGQKPKDDDEEPK